MPVEFVRPRGQGLRGGALFRRPPTVYVVEDDEDLAGVLAWMLKNAGYENRVFHSGAQALDQIPPDHPGCLLIDLSLPDMNGLDLRRRLCERGCRHPFLVLTGSGDVTLAVRSLHEGAIDFLQKPFNRDRLVHRIGEAIGRDGTRREFQSRLDSLTLREREILSLVVEGKLTKEIASQLAISPRTVDVHRHHILRKMGLRSVAQLIVAFNEPVDGGS